MKTLTTICCFARERGVNVLHGLLEDRRFSIAALVVHRKLPSSEDPNRRDREEFRTFQEVAARHGIPLYTVDTRDEARRLDVAELKGNYDLLLSVSWRFVIPERYLNKARVAALNMHRGRLPDYKGAEPVKRALLKGDQEIILCVHKMSAEIDAGEVILEVRHPAHVDPAMELDENVARIKKEMLPLYAPAMLAAIDRVLDTTYA